MTTKKWIVIGGVAVVCLLLCLCVSMCDSPGQTDVPQTQPADTVGADRVTYTISLESESGQSLPGIGVYVYTDSTMTELVWFARTDEDGRISFEDVRSDSFVAVLTDVPAGYLAQEHYPLTGEDTVLVLAAGLMEGDLNNITYKLGDPMLDFTVTDSDGKEYRLSQLLEEKKAVVLNFWYLQCDPCKSEFPFLQDGYSQYSDEVAVLAMNPVNADNEEIARFREENSYTFPMAACDPAWEKAMQLTAYPTTVVIDRFGTICFIHKGSITESGVFEAMFDFYSADDYEQAIFKDLEELQEAAGYVQTVGTKDNPVEIGAMPSFQVTVEPGQMMYYNIYRLTTTLYMSISNENAYVIYNGKTYYPTNGRVSLSISAEDTNSACSVVFGNSGKESQTYTVTLGSEPGSMGNPFRLTIGQFTSNVPAGNETGVWYTYTPPEDGLLCIEVQGVTAGVQYNISLTGYTANGIGTVQRSLSSEGSTNEETGNPMVAINAYAGKPIQVTVGTLPDSSNLYPAAGFQLLSTFAPGESLDTLVKEKITYSVNVTDENLKPISGVMMKLETGEGKSVTLTTGEEGVVTSRQEPGSYKIRLTVPLGYKSRFTEFTLTEAMPSVSIKLDTVVVEMETYTITVLDADGMPVPDAYVTIGTGYAKTDASGVVSITVPKAEYTATIRVNGQTVGKVNVTPDAPAATVTVIEGEYVEMMEYAVQVVDFHGTPVSGMTLTILEDGSVSTTAVTDSEGMALVELIPGSYSIGVPEGTYTDPSCAVITEDTLPTTDPDHMPVRIVLIYGPSGETGNIGESSALLVGPGATYLRNLYPENDNYVLFKPSVSGMYRISAMDLSATVSYWGTNTSFVPSEPFDMGYDSATNSYLLNVKEQHIGGTHMLGITNCTEAVLVIQRIGDAKLDETDLIPVVYQPQEEVLSGFRLTVPAGMKLEYVDVFASNAAAFSYVRGADGNYHLGSADGPVLYVRLGVGAPYLSMSDCMGVTVKDAVYPLNYVYYEDGNPVLKENYNTCMTLYVNACCPSTGVYPLNDDLILMFQRAAEVKGWGNYDGPDYLFKDDAGNKIPNANPALVWMYAVCYLTEG